MAGQPALFVGVNARCRHDTVVKPGDDGCPLCSLERFMLNLSPPFEVECVDAYGVALSKGEKYTVLCVVRDGEADVGKGSGYLLQSKCEHSKAAVARLYPLKHFKVV